jgi:hypothetical protein
MLVKSLLRHLAFTAFFIGVSAFQASPVLAAEDLEDLVKQIPSESCYNNREIQSLYNNLSL